jgi:hypothetical protein
MTVEWILANFPMMYDLVIVYKDHELTIGTNLEWLASQQPTSNPPTYAELCKLRVAQQGWKKVFDQWLEKGLIN